VRGVYTVEFNNITVQAADGDFDFFEIDPALEEPVEIVGIFIGQSSEVGDAQEEQIRWAILRYVGGTFTSGGEVSTTPRPVDPAGEAASGAYEACNSNGGVASSSGTTHRLHSDTFNVRTGLQLIFPPEMRPRVDGAAQSAMVVRCESTLTDDVTFSGTLYVREV
jgi:hypothetical protein